MSHSPEKMHVHELPHSCLRRPHTANSVMHTVHIVHVAHTPTHAVSMLRATCNLLMPGYAHPLCFPDRFSHTYTQADTYIHMLSPLQAHTCAGRLRCSFITHACVGGCDIIGRHDTVGGCSEVSLMLSAEYADICQPWEPLHLMLEACKVLGLSK